MTPTRKGRYTFCEGCVFKTPFEGHMACTKTHKEVRGDIKYERDFTICLVREAIRISDTLNIGIKLIKELNNEN